MLKIKDLTVKYGELTVVRDVSIDVAGGEIVALLGANGAGKSSIINAISGVNTDYTGTIEFMGQNIDKLSPCERVELGLIQIPEGRLLFGNMTVMDNLHMGSYPMRARTSFKENLERVFKVFPKLKERKGQIARTLSGGEQQMLAIGRGLMSAPRMLILDEPTWGLAPKLVSDVICTVARICEEGMTVLIVEQRIQQCLKVADRAYVIENGEIMLQGTGAQILENSQIKAAYLGI